MITGTVYDKTTNETLPGANVYFSDSAGSPGSATKGTATDTDGNFSFPAVYGEYLTASFLGYKRVTKPAVDGVMNFNLQPEAITLPEFEVIAKRDEPETNLFTTKNIVIAAAVAIIAASLVALLTMRR